MRPLVVLCLYTTRLLYYQTVIAPLLYSTLVILLLFYVHTLSSFVLFWSYCVISYHALFFFNFFHRLCTFETRCDDANEWAVDKLGQFALNDCRVAVTDVRRGTSGTSRDVLIFVQFHEKTQNSCTLVVKNPKFVHFSGRWRSAVTNCRTSLVAVRNNRRASSE